MGPLLPPPALVHRNVHICGNICAHRAVVALLSVRVQRRVIQQRRGSGGTLPVESSEYWMAGVDQSRARESPLWMKPVCPIHRDFPARGSIFQMLAGELAAPERPRPSNRNFANHTDLSRVSPVFPPGDPLSVGLGPVDRIDVTLRNHWGFRIVFWFSLYQLSFYEEDLSTQSPSSETPAWFSSPHADSGRPRNSQASSCQGPEAARRLTSNPFATLGTFVECSPTEAGVAMVESSWWARQGGRDPLASGSSFRNDVARL